MMTSASSRLSTLSYPCARSWPRTSSLSSTFIWQPKVSRYSFRRMPSAIEDPEDRRGQAHRLEHGPERLGRHIVGVETPRRPVDSDRNRPAVQHRSILL